MSVMMTIVVSGDPNKLEEHAASDPGAMQQILESAKEHGLIAHRFYGSEEGEIMVVDEWPDAQSFHSFFEANAERIGPLMQAAGVTSEPQPKIWRKLEAQDDYGWGA
jgi:heme-degrading monooxygenase HmoA